MQDITAIEIGTIFSPFSVQLVIASQNDIQVTYRYLDDFKRLLFIFLYFIYLL